MTNVVKAFSALFLLISLTSCSTVPYGQYGLLGVKDPGNTRVKASEGPVLTGESCSAMALIIPVKFGMQHMERAVEDAIEPLKRDDVVGLANVKVYQTVRSIFPFYTTFCWKVEGTPAIKTHVSAHGL